MSSQIFKSVVIDANLGLAQVLPLPYSKQVEAQLQRWEEEHAWIFVPALWEYEVVSGLRRACALKMMTLESAHEALNFLLEMNFETTPTPPDQHQRALEWAERLGQNRAYDAQYLALAEQLGAELWTADRRLANAAAGLGLDWVHWVEET